jgi:hypothetical protein
MGKQERECSIPFNMFEISNLSDLLRQLEELWLELKLLICFLPCGLERVFSIERVPQAIVMELQSYFSSCPFV